ncbi:hypothetical protein [Nocardia sp. NPDC050406]|uniref:hypothetical protein n=1 Tax=Nocardia sp. NPDC050406 TaxID=3364318 RepID=UPI0037BE1A75
MQSRPTPHRRRSYRLFGGALLAGLLVVLGLVAAIADGGSAQPLADTGTAASVISARDTAATDTAVSARFDQTIDHPVPLCGKRDHPGTDPLGNIAPPPRTFGDQLLSPLVALTPECTAAQWISYDIQPRAPTLPVASPHLTTVLLI